MYVREIERTYCSDDECSVKPCSSSDHLEKMIECT